MIDLNIPELERELETRDKYPPHSMGWLEATERMAASTRPLLTLVEQLAGVADKNGVCEAKFEYGRTTGERHNEARCRRCRALAAYKEAGGE